MYRNRESPTIKESSPNFVIERNERSLLASVKLPKPSKPLTSLTANEK